MTGHDKKLVKLIAWAGALVITLVGLTWLERERSSVTQSRIITSQGAVVLYQDPARSDGPLIVVTHGFAGSHQMMQYISRDLARAGYTVAAFDFYGHGRNTRLLSPDVTRIEGTTLQLVGQTSRIISEVRDTLGLGQSDFALLGHSMSTDIIIRAAQDMPEVVSIAAISMYSDAVTDRFPQNLLILSGEWEGRLRDVGLRLVAQVDPEAGEGETVSNGVVTRRTDYIPNTEHVAVLYSAVTQQHLRDWFGQTLAAAHQSDQPLLWRGPAIVGVFLGLVALFALSVQFMPRKPSNVPQPTRLQYGLALIAPAFCATVAAAFGPSELLGLSAFGTLIWFLSVWGAVQLACLGRAHLDIARPSIMGILTLILAGGAVFAFALDRYAAAFMPTDVRWALMACLLPATILFACADRMIVREARLWRRLLARGVAVATLGGAMAALGDFGLLFTVVPVLCLFYLVYGTMGRIIATRFNPLTAGLGLGVILAWSIAASTPLFAA